MFGMACNGGEESGSDRRANGWVEPTRLAGSGRESDGRRIGMGWLAHRGSLKGRSLGECEQKRNASARLRNATARLARGEVVVIANDCVGSKTLGAGFRSLDHKRSEPPKPLGGSPVKTQNAVRLSSNT